jgi:outer membrane protein assembly factor BamA
MRRAWLTCALVALAAAAQAQEVQQTPGDTAAAPLQKPGPGTEAPDFGTGVSFFPIPNVANGKNEGTTLGLIGAFLYPDEHGDIGSVFTVGVGDRDLVGINVFLDYRTNPTPYSFIEFFASKAETVEQEYQVYFEDRKVDHGRFNMLFEFDRATIATNRFFGREDDAPLANESVYTSDSYRTRLYFGPNLDDDVSLQGTFRFAHTSIEHSIVPNVPQTIDVFPNEPGIETGNVYAFGASLTYEGRDNVNTPTEGAYGNVFAEAARFVSDEQNVPYYRVGAEGKKLWPWTDERTLVTVVRMKCQFEFGDEVPFYELSALGGEKTLRGYGSQRFTNKDMVLVNLEQRIRVWQMSLFGVKGDIQLAPFVDLGEVFDTGTGDFLHNPGIHYSYGCGLRGVVNPYVVGRIDIGFGTEGAAVAVGIDYPF